LRTFGHAEAIQRPVSRYVRRREAAGNTGCAYNDAVDKTSPHLPQREIKPFFSVWGIAISQALI